MYKVHVQKVIVLLLNFCTHGGLSRNVLLHSRGKRVALSEPFCSGRTNIEGKAEEAGREFHAGGVQKLSIL